MGRLQTYAIPSLILAGTLLACAPPLEAEPRMARWKALPVRYKVASTLPDWAVQEVRRGFDQWNDSVGAQIFVFDGKKELDPDHLAPDYTVFENVVLMTQEPGDTACTDPKTSCGPLARVSLRGTSAIVDADIYLFQFDLNFVDGRTGTGDLYSIADVILHEAGHILWGAPESTDPASVVYPILYPIDHPLEKSTPTEKDREVVHSLYASDAYYSKQVGTNGFSQVTEDFFSYDSMTIDERPYR